jgi:hypothetical protein
MKLERHANHHDVYGCQKYINMGNYVGHDTFPKAKTTLLHLNATIRNLPFNSTYLWQPYDLFVISKIEDTWTKQWEQKNLQLIIDNKWMDDGLGGSFGALRNPIKPYFLQLVAIVVRDTNAQRDKNEISYARKTMI